MRQFKYATSLLATVVVVLGLSGPAPAAEPAPFKGSLEGIRVSSTPLDPPFVMNTLVVTGNATQIGKFALVVPSVVNTTTLDAEGFYIFTAANGDTLTASFTGLGADTEVPGVVFIVEIAAIDPTRSTGRFAGATGAFVVKRLLDRPAGKTIGSFEGTISLLAPDQP